MRALVEGDYVDFILCHAKETLIKGGRDAGLTDIRTSSSKAKLIEYFLANVTFKTAHHYCGGGEFIALGDTEPVEFMLYLYFGKTEDDLKNLALRDLGIIIRTNKHANLSARFTDEAEARACFHYSRLLDRLETNSEEVYRSAITAMLGGPHCTTDYACDLRSKAAHRVRSLFRKATRERTCNRALSRRLLSRLQ